MNDLTSKQALKRCSANPVSFSVLNISSWCYMLCIYQIHSSVILKWLKRLLWNIIFCIIYNVLKFVLLYHTKIFNIIFSNAAKKQSQYLAPKNHHFTLGISWPCSRLLGSYSALRLVVHGPTALICRLRFSSCGAEVRVKGWYSLAPRLRQDILTHWPDLYSKLAGLLNIRAVTSV